ERNLLQSLCWRAAHRLRGWMAPRLAARGLIGSMLRARKLPRATVIEHVDTVAAIERVTAPLDLRVSSESPPRVNLVISIIDFKYVFGGYITVFHLARLLAERGFKVRLVVVDECDFRPVAFAHHFRA